MAAYSGDWVLLRLESDDLDRKFRDAMADRPRSPGGGVPGGGADRRPPGGGGMTGGRGGRMPGMGPGGAGNVDAEEMRRVLETTRLITRTHTELLLTLRPESATLRPADGVPLVLPLSGEEQSVVRGEAEYFAAAGWTDEGLLIERKVDGGGRVTDKIQVDQAGRLVVEREIDALRGGTVKGTLVYERKEE
jgi:hypothetical protein